MQAQEAALDAFSSLCRENIDIARASLNARGRHRITYGFGRPKKLVISHNVGIAIAPFGQMTLTTMLDLVRDKSQSMRLAAATW